MSSFHVPVQIRFRDIDMNHHVNNAVYFTYMESARTVLLYDDLIKYHLEGFQFLVAEASCRYKSPIQLNDNIICNVGFIPIRPTSCDISYHFINEESEILHAEGITRMVLFNINTMRPVAIPEWFTNKYLTPREMQDSRY